MESKYKKGDQVYFGGCEYSAKNLPCPDCLGTLVWTVIFANGDVQEIDCQTCKKDYKPSGVVAVNQNRPVVNKYTIGSVRYNDTDKEPFSYMCNETGVGSGRVYYQNELFETYEEAMIFAKNKSEESLKLTAQNNFGGKFRETIEDLLSTYGFTRELAVKKGQEFRKWAGISGIIKSKRKPKSK